ncbi:MAG TPA: hypothetical protein VIL85_10880 [Thermomicrobiales bacterium]|jgi:hypothetical protein
MTSPRDSTRQAHRSSDALAHERGRGDGWFNFGAAWLVEGIPGMLFAAAAVSFKRRYDVSLRGVTLGPVSGAAALLALGVIIG